MTQHTAQWSLIIVDDHPLVRRGIRETVLDDGRFTIVREIGDGALVLKAVEELEPDVLLLDLNLPGMHGLDIIRGVRGRDLKVEIVVMTMHREAEVADAVRSLHVRGYLLKESAEDHLIPCLESVLSGRHYYAPELSDYLLGVSSTTGSSHSVHPALSRLTRTERQVLSLIAAQLTSREIAERIHVSVFTVHNHRNNICQKLALHGSNALLKFAIERRDFLMQWENE